MQTLKHIGIIALNTFRESIRDKILYNIGFLAIALTLFSIVLGEWSVFDRAYVIKSTTLSVMSLSGLLISIFVGISLVQKEIQRRTVLTLLSKPISRAAFIVGKYFGLLAVVAVHLALLTAIYYVMLFLTGSAPTLSLLTAIYLIFCEMAVVIAVALLFSSVLRFQILHKSKHLDVHRGLQNASIHEHLANIFLVSNLAPMRLNLCLSNNLVVHKDFRHVLVSHRKSLRLNHQLAIARKTPM